MNAQKLILSIELAGKAATPKRMPAELSLAAGVNRSTWQRIKAGTVKPSYETLISLQRLAREFGIDPISPMAAEQVSQPQSPEAA